MMRFVPMSATASRTALMRARRAKTSQRLHEASGGATGAFDRFEMRDPIQLDKDTDYCLDRRGLGLDRLLLEGLE